MFGISRPRRARPTSSSGPPASPDPTTPTSTRRETSALPISRGAARSLLKVLLLQILLSDHTPRISRIIHFSGIPGGRVATDLPGRLSGVGDRVRRQDALEGAGGVAEAFGAGEAERQFGDDQVGFEDAEPVVAVGDGVGDQAGDLAVALAGGDVLVRPGIVVLDVEVGDPRAEQSPRPRRSTGRPRGSWPGRRRATGWADSTVSRMSSTRAAVSP